MKRQSYSENEHETTWSQHYQTNDNIQAYKKPDYESYAHQNSNSKKQKNSLRNRRQPTRRNVPRLILYFLVFLVLVFLCFYAFDYFQATNNFSIALGVIVCLIVQFRVIGMWGQEQMRHQNIDQIEIVRMKIKNIFGQLRQKTVNRKSSNKYYTYTNSPNDKLFDQQNIQLFDTVMTNIRGKKQFADKNYSLEIRRKWNILQGKLFSIQKIIEKISILYQARGSSYKKLFTVLTKFDDLDYSKWQSLFGQSENSKGSITPQLLSPHTQPPIKMSSVKNWKTLTLFLQQRGKYNQNRLKDIMDNVLFEFNIYLKQMKIQKQATIKKIDDLYAECNLKRQRNKDITHNIDTLKAQIDNLENAIQKLRMKSAENIEDIFKNEVQLRLRRVQLQNEQVRKSNMKDGMQKSSEQYYKYYCKQNQWLEGYGVKVFNKKIINYINLLLEHQEIYYHKLLKHLKELQLNSEAYNLTSAKENWRSTVNEDKKKGKQINIRKKQTQHLMEIQQGMDSQQMIQVYKQYTKIQQSFKQYITSVLAFHIQIENNVREAAQIITSYDKDSFKQYGRGKIVWADRKFIKVLQALLAKEVKIADKCLNLVRTQFGLYQIYQKQSKLFSQKITQINQRINKINQRGNNSKQTSEQLNFQLILSLANQTKQLKNDLYSKIRQCINSPFKSLLSDIIGCIFTLQAEVHDDLPVLSGKQDEDYEEDPRYSRFAQYSDYYSRQQFEQGWQQGNCEKMVNRLLNMFFKQWCNSQFFHEIVKQEIDISLNRKRPSIVDAIEVVYLKIHQKEIDPVENIVVHQSQPFQVLFDFTLNFKGKIAVHLLTKLKVPKQIPIDIKILIKQFKCPIRVCFTPYGLGKNFASLLDRPYLSVDYNVKIGNTCITKIPLVSTIIKGYILIKLRKKMMWPKRFTLAFPMAYKSPLNLAIRERNKFQKQQIKKKLRK